MNSQLAEYKRLPGFRAKKKKTHLKRSMLFISLLIFLSCYVLIQNFSNSKYKPTLRTVFLLLQTCTLRYKTYVIVCTNAIY